MSTAWNSEELPPGRVGQVVRAPKMAELIATRIRRSIVTRRLAEGDALPSEAELMAQFGVSRPTLREAFRILETESLLSIRRGARGGARVTAPDIAVASRYVGMLLQMSGTTIGEVYEARGVVEGAAVGILATTRTAEDLAELGKLATALSASGAEVSMERWSVLSLGFHEALVHRAGNRALATQWGVLRDVTEKHLNSTVANAWDHPRTADAVRKSGRSYKKLLTLLEAGAAAEAESHWREHMRVSGRVLAGSAESMAIVDLFE